ncbi:MAG: ferrous iron transport protein A [Eubacteriales bacterium]
MTLDELKIGSSAVIKSVGGEGALRCRLLDMGLIPKTKVTLQKVAPMGDPIEIHIRGYELTLRIDDAKKITVEEIVNNTQDKKVAAKGGGLK